MRSLEAIGVLEKDDDKGGRRITQSGQRDLDREYIPKIILLCRNTRESRFHLAKRLGISRRIGTSADAPA